jgi:hypothetical protein
MRLVWDEGKRQANLDKHGVDFAAAEQSVWETALVGEDRRADYGERREVAVGFIGPHL